MSCEEDAGSRNLIKRGRTGRLCCQPQGKTAKNKHAPRDNIAPFRPFNPSQVEVRLNQRTASVYIVRASTVDAPPVHTLFPALLPSQGKRAESLGGILSDKNSQ